MLAKRPPLTSLSEPVRNLCAALDAWSSKALWPLYEPLASKEFEPEFKQIDEAVSKFVSMSSADLSFPYDLPATYTPIKFDIPASDRLDRIVAYTFVQSAAAQSKLVGVVHCCKAFLKFNAFRAALVNTKKLFDNIEELSGLITVLAEYKSAVNNVYRWAEVLFVIYTPHTLWIICSVQHIFLSEYIMHSIEYIYIYIGTI